MHCQSTASCSGRSTPVYRRGPTRSLVVHVAAAVKTARRGGGTTKLAKEPLVVTLDPAGSDTWRLKPIIELLEQGAVGIIPTDTLPALVCDLENRSAVARLYGVKDLAPKKQLSILVRSFADISTYTLGFPVSNNAGDPDVFSTMRRILPGPYTMILPASKSLPREVVDFTKGTTKNRKEVGVRMPSDKTCQAILDGLGRPLLCTSVHVPDHLSPDTELPDAGTMLDMYAGKGIDFLVDVGRRVATESTVIDMTGARPMVTRAAKGDVSMFETAEEDDEWDDED